MAYFSPDDLARLSKFRADCSKKFGELREKYAFRVYQSDRAGEYARQGFCRRLDTLIHCIEFVFNVLPPEQTEIPDDENVVAVTIFIQSFVVNAFGCLDNLAWIWIYETNFKGRWGKAIDPKAVGLGPRYSYLRRQFTAPFRTYLKSRKKWFRHLTEFRDTLAHRIPLYIPPYIVPEEKADEYRRLGDEAYATAQWEDGKRAAAEYVRLTGEQLKLGVFRPWITHSVNEKSPHAVFHYQLLQDFLTIHEFGQQLLDELDRRAEAAKEAPSRPGTVLQWAVIAGASIAACAMLYLRFLN